MQNMDSYILHWWGWKLSRVWFLKWVCCVPPNIVSSPVSPQHQSSAVTISLQKLTFSAFISFITLKRFKPTKHNISVSITCSPSQRSKISNVDTFMQEFDRNYDSLTSPQKKSYKERILLLNVEEPISNIWRANDERIQEYSFDNFKTKLKQVLTKCRSQGRGSDDQLQVSYNS